jgi:signal peptidase I
VFVDNLLENKGLNLDEFDYNGRNHKSKIKAIGEFVWEMAKVAIISLVIILPIRYFLIQPFYVKGASMEPNFYDHEYLIIDEISYRFGVPGRGDIVVFKYPKDPDQYFIKRVIGLPGETVEVKNDQVLIDGQPLAENYLSEGVSTRVSVGGYEKVTLEDDEYFLLGDNREQSLDSRVFGPVKADFIIGRTWLRGWPFNRLTIFYNPDYNI